MHVYIIEGNDRIKIGYSQSPASRVVDIQPNISDDIKLAYQTGALQNYRLVERLAHKLLKPNRVKGEWFKVTVERGIEVISQAISIAEQQQEDIYLAVKPYKYKSVNISILGEGALQIMRVRELMEKRLNTRLSLAKLTMIIVNEELARLEADPAYQQQ